LLAAIDDSPGNLPAYRALFAYYMKNGQLDEAAHWAQAALHTLPGSAWPQIMIGRVALAQERVAVALRAFSRARMMRPDLADPLIGMAAAYLVQGSNTAAVAQARLAVQVEPYRSDAFAALGDALRSAGDKAAARVAYRKALSLDGGNTQASNGLQSVGDD
jgi:cytochrome c-type biogenesis protein CcmH/NrfG